jgi:hypothetical protein
MKYYGQITILALFVIATTVLPSLAQTEQIDPDFLSSGIATRTVTERAPCGHRVTWVNWDSPFRAAGLQIGDLITTVNNVQTACPPPVSDAASQEAANAYLRNMTQLGIGGVSERNTWKTLGFRDGSALVLKVMRHKNSNEGSESLEIRGSVRAERLNFASNGKPMFGSSGPIKFEKDGFNSVWSNWYEDFMRRAERVLDAGWIKRINNRQLLSEWLQDKPRIESLKQKFPGAFANAVNEDWQNVLKILAGGEYAVSDKDLEYRQLGEKRSAQIKETSSTSFQAMQKKLEKDMIAPFPAVNPLEDRAKAVGKVVLLPVIKPRDWVNEGNRCYLRSGDAKRGYYFVACQSKTMNRLFEAQERYQRTVNPDFLENYTILGRVLDEPKMLVVNNQAATGLMLEPLGVLVEERVFVDLTAVKDNVSLFAGEAALSSERLAMPKDSASPKEVMQALINALKWGDQKLWNALFAESQAWIDEKNRIRYSLRSTNSMNDDWLRSRRLILEPVFDVKIVFVSDAEMILTGTEFVGAPRIEQVSVELRHIGRFENKYSAFVDINVHPLWLLQRINNGAWRIISEQGI